MITVTPKAVGKIRETLDKNQITGGLRLVVSSNVVLKAEYLNNRQYGGIRPFKDDIFTSSLVLAY